MTHEEKAAALFRQGCNCAQAVLAATCELTGLERDTAMRLGASLGAGMGRLRETCGAVTGLLLVAGLLYGGGEVASREQLAEHYALVQELAGAFRAEHGSICCRELLKNNTVTAGTVPEQRTQEYYKTRPCEQYVRTAVRLLDELIGRRENG